jgi:osmotically-inducible protein OsmY
MGLAAAPVVAASVNDAQLRNGPVILATADDEHHSDTWITTKVKAKLLEENFKTGVDIKVSTHDGVVQLAGYVKKADQVSLASDIAANVEGVKRVQNDLIIK